MRPLMSPAPGITQGSGGFVRSVQDNELTSSNLNRLLDSNNRYLRSARARGANFASSRGNLNSSLAAANAEQAAIDAALPIATQDADAYKSAAGQNLEAVTQQGIAAGNNATQLAVTGMNTASDQHIANMRAQLEREQNALERTWRTGEREGDQRWRTDERADEQRWRTNERIGDQNWRSNESSLDRNWRSRESNLDRMFQANQSRLASRGGIFGEIVGTVFSDPTYWRDQAGAAGFIQTWTDTLTPMFDRIFNQPMPPQTLPATLTAGP